MGIIQRGNFLFAAVAIAALSFSGCAGQLGMPSDDQLLVEARQGRVYGRIEYLENGQEPDRGSALFPKFDLTVLVYRTSPSEPVPPGKAEELSPTNVRHDGTFRWQLKPGNYSILSYHIRRGSSAFIASGRVMGSFSIPRPGAKLYIGDLRIDARANGSRVELVDRYDDASKRIAAPENALLDKALMYLEPLPGTYQRVTGICDDSWGIACDEDYRGVRPVKPEGTVRGFPTSQNLQPVLEWTPSTNAEVTYDVAIYESYDRVLARTGQFRGALVHYAQGLNEPRYSTPPLAANKRYEWTVRARRGDTVSTWSATNYGWFIAAPGLFAGQKGSGRGFGFETPAQ